MLQAGLFSFVVQSTRELQKPPFLGGVGWRKICPKRLSNVAGFSDTRPYKGTLLAQVWRGHSIRIKGIFGVR
jgi:hypothetical protein